MSAIELMEEVAKQGLKVAGMSATEAANALGFTQLANGMFVKNIINSTAGKVLEFPTSTAVEAIAEAGTSATTAASSTTANLTLVETASGATSTAGILSIAAPVAASLLAAVGGYLIGNEVYNNNQDFFDNLTGSFMEYLADGTVNLIGLLDSNGNTYFDRRAYTSVKAYLDSFASTSVDYIWTTDTLTVANFKPTCDAYTAFARTISHWVISGRIISTKIDISKLLEIYKGAIDYIESKYGTDKVMCLTSYSPDIDYSMSTAYPSFRFCITVFSSISSVAFINRSNNDNTQLISVTGTCTEVPFVVSTALASGNIQVTSVAGNAAFNTFFISTGNVSPTVGAATSIEQSYANGASNINSIEKSTLPDGVTKYSPKTSLLKDMNLFTIVNGCPQELPYIPVRIPKNPTVIPFPDPEVNPSENDPNDEPNRINPIIPPNPPYPDNVPDTTPKPKPDTTTNPDKKPITLPDPTPDKNITTDTDPDPDKDPSQDTASDPDTKTPVDDDGTTNPDDGGSTPDPTPPIVTPIYSSATGLLHVYHPNISSLNNFGAWLWTTFSGDLIDTLAKLFNNPMDAVIGLHELYATPCNGGISTIKCGYLDSGISSYLVLRRYTEINCGSLVIPEHWGNYLDYTPYTKVYCYLPFIGIVELNADDIIAHGVNITYRIDSYTGACIAIITVAKDNYNSATYQFSGNCAVEIPITSGVKATMQNALIGAATAGIMATAGAGVTLASVGASALRGGASRAINSKNEVQHSGSFGSSFGAMGFKKPYLIVKRPRQKVVAGYNENYGYPAHKMVAISECSGYLRAREVDVISVTATEDEKKLIETALKSGVFVS